jgi:hypothetical protein
MDTYEVKFTNRIGERVRRYGVSMVDTFTKAAWHVRVATKDQVAQAVINTLKEIEREGGGQIRRIFSDGGSEFVNQTLKSYLAREGIKLRVSPANTQALNGVAERFIRTCKDRARCMLHHAGKGTDWLWHHAMSHAVWLWNRSRVSTANEKTPYEAATGKTPSLREKHVGVWGCDCFVHQRKKQRIGTMAAKSEPGIYIGHDQEHNAPAVILLRTGKVVFTKDVRFINDRFAHLRAFQAGEEEVEAVLDGDEPLLHSEEYPDEEMPAQGVVVQPSEQKEQEEADEDDDSADKVTVADEEPEKDAKEWVVDKIIKCKNNRAGDPMYRVRWERYGPEEDTWESADTVKDLEALDTFLARRQDSAPLRRGRSAGLSGDALDSTGSDLASDGERVEMAMLGQCQARRGLGNTGEWIEEEPLRRAIVAVASTSGSISDRTPNTLAEAMSGPDAEKWQAARQKEYDSCIALTAFQKS